MPLTLQVLAWCLATGIIAGGVWMAIVLLGGQRRLTETQAELTEELARRDETIEQLEDRLADAEARLEFAERLLTRQREPERLPPDHAP